MHLRNRGRHVPGIQSEYRENNEVAAAFKEMKKLVAKLPTLTAPIERERRIDCVPCGCAGGHSLGAGMILTNPEGAEFTYALRFRFDTTNNEAEYEALIAGLRITEQMGVKNLQINVDSRLVANQVNGSYIAKEPGMIHFAYLTKHVLVEELKEKSINEAEVLAVLEEEGDTWMTPIYNYLMEETLPAEKEKTRVVRHKPRSMHAETRSVVAKAIWTRYYWPTMHAHTRKLIGACQDCQVPGKVKFLIVAMDYFTKWIEAKPVTTITGNQVKKFIWDNIVCRFSRPREIISDNRKQFRDNPFKYWCEKLCIRQCFASVKHPQANGLLERENRSLGEGIKARLDEKSKDWIEELSHVLWVHRTMIKSSNRDTPFSLTYGTEAVIPAEISMPNMRTAEVDMVQNNEALEINLDLLEERREQAAICKAKSKAKMEKYYNSKVCNTSFNPEDLVYRSNEVSHAKESGKLSPKWEGPYEVTEALGKGAYKLRDRNGKLLPRTWNVRNLKKCYVHEM
ncbi:reverse transcriptase domain-containing protein [Tanacetum coccineum]